MILLLQLPSVLLFNYITVLNVIFPIISTWKNINFYSLKEKITVFGICSYCKVTIVGIFS